MDLPGTRAAAGVTRSIDKALGGALICIHSSGLSDAGWDPLLRLVGDVAKELDLDLVRGMKPFCGTIRLVERAERVRTDPVKIEVIAAIYGACSVCTCAVGMLCTWPVSTGGAIVPIAFGKPSVPALVHEVARTRAGIRIRDAGGEEVTGQRDFIVARPMIGETAEDVGGIGCVVINRIFEVAIGRLGELPVICSAMK